MSHEIRFGNAVNAKPSNLNALLQVRKRITSFVEQSDFMAKNFKRIQKIEQQKKLK